MTDRLINGLAEDADFVTIDGNAEDISDLQKDIDSQMNSIFQEFGGDDNDTEFKINVKRAMRDKGELEHCFTCTPQELPITERIKEEYGHGAYQIWIYKDGKIYKRRNLHIAKTLKPSVLVPVNGNQDVSQLISAMTESNRQQMEQLQGLVNQPQKQPLNILEIITAITTVIPVIKDVLAPAPQVNQMDVFMKAATFMQDIKGEGEKESNAFDMIGKLAQTFGPGIMEMSSQLQNQQQISPQTQPQTQPQIQAQPPRSGTQIAPQPEQEKVMIADEQQELTQLKHQLGMLVAMAHAKKDPLLYADLILDQVPDAQIRRYILRDDVIPFLSNIEPNVQHFVPWFTELHNAIAGAYEESEISLNDQESLTEQPAESNTVGTVENVISHDGEKSNEQEINAATKLKTDDSSISDTPRDT